MPGDKFVVNLEESEVLLFDDNVENVDVGLYF